ncbi:hypothetical protein AVEN_212163-1 [Araneus ventricosus]|uniref:Uncharacterized protein n=1 Tax=Araneus ventricosus TaxID=182803 RepID=A0A4Y2HC06_ARAVE|nr:hypothetical protein AVEN_212163-1 [Araneus ventricosus]
MKRSLRNPPLPCLSIRVLRRQPPDLSGIVALHKASIRCGSCDTPASTWAHQASRWTPRVPPLLLYPPGEAGSLLIQQLIQQPWALVQ